MKDIIHTDYQVIKNNVLPWIHNYSIRLDEISETEHQLREVIDQSYDGIVLTNEYGAIIEWNYSQQRITGLKLEDVQSKPIWDVIQQLIPFEKRHASIYEQNKVAIQSVLRSGIAPWINRVREHEIMRPDGSRRLVQSTFFPISKQKKFMIGSIIRDITAQKKVETARLEMEEFRSKFIEITSHELRTPLTIIKGFVNFLQSSGDTLSSEKREKSLKLIQDNITRLQHLMDKVSDLAKIERNTLEVNLQVVDINNYITKLVESFTVLLGDDFIFYPMKCDFPCYIKIDTSLFQQVLENMVSNAIKHTHKDTRLITLSIKETTKSVQIDITDNGAGIVPENLERIFEPFVSIQTKYSVTGSGIGLFVSREIIHQHGGVIRAFSNGSDQGTTISIILPRILIKNINKI